MKIMVITKNILSETAFQNRLQHLDHQVFCTTCLIGEIKESHLFYRKFDAIILSETIPRKEQYLYLKELARVKTPLFLLCHILIYKGAPLVSVLLAYYTRQPVVHVLRLLALFPLHLTFHLLVGWVYLILPKGDFLLMYPKSHPIVTN